MPLIRSVLVRPLSVTLFWHAYGTPSTCPLFTSSFYGSSDRATLTGLSGTGPCSLRVIAGRDQSGAPFLSGSAETP